MTQAKVYIAIASITDEMSKDGISKDRKNQTQGYAFRGIDDVLNALSPMLAKHKLCILPRVLERQQVERQTAKGGVLFYTTVKVEYDFVSAEDGSSHTVVTYGEAMDSADKSTNKAMSAAYKYAAFQTFCIPTEGDNDADATTHEVKPKPKQLTEEEKQDLINQINASQNEGDVAKAYATAAAIADSLNDKELRELFKKNARDRKTELKKWDMEQAELTNGENQ